MQLRLENISKRYGKTAALHDVSLTIDPGQVVAVLGANGAGKTTLLRLLSTVVGPSRGEILVDGEKLTRGNLGLRERLAFLPDFPIAFPNNTVLRHIGMVLRLYGRDEAESRNRVLELLKGFDLLTLIDKAMGELSRGQAYKAALAALLAVSPELLLLDEPFASGMDPNGITFLKRELAAASKRGHTVLYTTQILEIVEKVSDRVCVLQNGEVVRFAAIGELRAAAASADSGVLEQLFQQLREQPQ